MEVRKNELLGNCRCCRGWSVDFFYHWLNMNRKLCDSIRRYPYNLVIILGVLSLYFLNNSYFKSHTAGIVRYIMICHFNDYLCGVLFLAYSNIFLATRNLKLRKIFPIILYSLFSGVFWEYVTPLYRKKSVSDWLDVFAYVLGGITYWFIVRMIGLIKREGRNAGSSKRF